MVGEYCDIISGGSLHVWTNGDINKLLCIMHYVLHVTSIPHQRIDLCQPNRGNKYKWDLFIQGTNKNKQDLQIEIKTEFF